MGETSGHPCRNPPGKRTGLWIPQTVTANPGGRGRGCLCTRGAPLYLSLLGHSSLSPLSFPLHFSSHPPFRPCQVKIPKLQTTNIDLPGHRSLQFSCGKRQKTHSIPCLLPASTKAFPASANSNSAHFKRQFPRASR